MRQMNGTLENLLRAFRYRNYRLFFLGQSVAVTGLWMTMAALGWLIYRLTGDPFTLGLMGFCLHAPTFLIAPFGGVLVDRVSRRKVIVWAQAANGLTILILAALTLADRVTVWQILTACVFMGIAKAFEMPARQALVVDIVEDRSALSNAIALNSSIFHGARLVGPMLAGALIIPFFGEGYCFLLHAAGYLIAIPCFAALKPKPLAPKPEKQSVFRDLGEGFAYAFGYPPVRALLFLVTAFAMLGQAFNTLLPVFAKTVLSGDSGTYGLLLAASGLGAVVAAIQLATRRSVLGMGRIISLSALLFGITLLLFAQSTTLLFSLPLLVIAGLASINVMVGANTIIQTLVEDHLRGRVMSLMGTVFMGAMPVGTLLYGKTAAWIGAPSAVVFGATGCLLAGLIFRLRLPSLRRIARPRYIEQGILSATMPDRR